MTIKHHRSGVLARWFHRCPKCGKWMGLHKIDSQHNISGTHRSYQCRSCGEKTEDWKPSAMVKF